MTDSQGVYTHPPAQGASDLDRTSFFAPQRDWGFHAREYRPDVLFQWEEIETPEVPHPGFMIDQGRIVLDSHNHPVVNWDIPLTLSSEIEGGRLEAMHRLNSKINKDDFCARMPNERVDTSGKVGKRQIPNAFGQRMLRFRMKSGIPTWNTKTGSDEVRARIVECIPRETVAEILRTNSTRCFRDLSEKELLYVEQGNAGKAISRAGGHRLSKAERDKRFQRRFAGLKGWEPPNKRPWPENYTTYINGSRKGKRSEHENPRQRGDDSEPSESQSLTPSERQGFEFSRDTGYGQRNPQLTEEKENIPPARTEAPRSYANGMPKDQRRPNNQPTPQSQAQRALNDHIPVPNSEFWQYASIDENQRKRLHPTTEGYHYAKNISKESIPETPNIAANNSRQRFDYEVSPYNQKHGFKIYVSPESMRTHNDMEMPDMSYGQPDVAVPPSEFSRKRRMDQAFSQDEIALAPNRSSRKRKANATFSQDEIALPFNEFSRKRKVDEAFPLDETSRPNDLMPPPKRPAMQMQHKPTDSNPPNEGDGRYDDPENFDEVRFIQSALSNTLAELSQRLGYTPDIETCPNHSYIRQFNQIESWFKANWRGTKAAPKLTTMEKPWKGGIPPPEELFLGF